jgi:hypothetical protein
MTESNMTASPISSRMNAETLFKNAKHCLRQAALTTDDMQRMRYLRAAKAWRALAEAKLDADEALASFEVVDAASKQSVA